MLESFFLQSHRTEVEAQWRQKTLVSCEILGGPAIHYLRPEIRGDRTRLDLMWNGKSLGVRGRTKVDGTFDFYTVNEPDTAASPILEMMSLFNQSKCPLKQAQMRFRASFDGQRGLWIDTANLQIKDLLHEPSWLRRIRELGWIIEVGQKQKEVMEQNGDLVLEKARPQAWLCSYSAENSEIPLLSYISIFSQPGPETNRALIAAGFELLDLAGISKLSWIEWGAGYGNLSAAYSTKLGSNGCSSEMEAAAAELLERNARDYFPQVKTSCWSAERGVPKSEIKSRPIVEDYELWLLDPPRPGFPKLIEKLLDPADSLKKHRPKWMLCYHCHATGLIADSARLKKADYELVNWISVDAFPATPHQEVISLWKAK